jgi:ATP-dependent Clp protease ATP-binding subunit ClpA
LYGQGIGAANTGSREYLLREANMFERYTEKTRRVIFFARYEASHFGSPYIETEHLLLGLVREAKDVVLRFNLNPDAIRRQIEEASLVREKVSNSVDLPLSNESKRVLAYAAEEAERLSHRYIGTEHFLLALLREGNSAAAEILRNAGLRLENARREIKSRMIDTGESSASPHEITIEFILGVEAIAVVGVVPNLPRYGDELVLELEGRQERCTVERVQFQFAQVAIPVAPNAQRLEKVKIHLKRLSAT